MTPRARHPRQQAMATWLAQIVGTIVFAVVVYFFVQGTGFHLSSAATPWQRYGLMAILAASVPALAYLRTFKRHLNAAEAAMRSLAGGADPAARRALLRSLSIGGALCELPMALGVLNLLLGGETRWFVGATLVTLAMRLSYRPFAPPAA